MFVDWHMTGCRQWDFEQKPTKETKGGTDGNAAGDNAEGGHPRESGGAFGDGDGALRRRSGAGLGTGSTPDLFHKSSTTLPMAAEGCRTFHQGVSTRGVRGFVGVNT